MNLALSFRNFKSRRMIKIIPDTTAINNVIIQTTTSHQFSMGASYSGFAAIKTNRLRNAITKKDMKVFLLVFVRVILKWLTIINDCLALLN
jgi:hypothetical protein